MKTFYSKFVFYIAAVAVVSCTSIPNSTSFSKTWFGGNLNKPIVTAKTSDGLSLTLLFDTGGATALYASGLRKIGMVTNSKLDQTKSYTVNVANVSVGTYKMANITFSYDPAVNSGYDTANVDGSIGLASLGGCKTVTIDYVHSRISIDADKLVGVETKLYKDPVVTNFYEIDVLIDGKPDIAVIDTGNNAVSLRRDYGIETKRMKPEETVDFIQNGKVEMTKPHDILIKKFSIGTREYTNVRCFYGTDKRAKTSQKARNAFTLYNSLGYSLFKGCVIQLDLVDGLFVIN